MSKPFKTVRCEKSIIRVTKGLLGSQQHRLFVRLSDRTIKTARNFRQYTKIPKFLKTSGVQVIKTFSLEMKQLGKLKYTQTYS